MRIEATACHDLPDRPAMSVDVGDIVHVGVHDSDWPAFVFVTHGREQGWVPERYLDSTRPHATVLTAYSTAELAVREGQCVDVIRRHDPSGWAWCRAGDGAEGWVPHRVLGLVD